MQPLNLLDILDFTRRHARRILAWSLALAAAGYLTSFLIPPRYAATGAILPPDEDELSGDLSGYRRGLAGLGGLARFGSAFSQADIALAILRSRSLHEQVVERLDLRVAYKAESLEQAVSKLRSRSRARLSADGTISVSAEDASARRAAEIANTILSELDAYNRKFRSFRARRTRIFLERRLAEADSSLRTVEESLAYYQRKKGSIVLPAEVRGALDAAVNLSAQKLAAEVELQILRSYASPQSDEVRRLEARVQELHRKVGELPITHVGGAELLRQVGVQQELYTLLTAQLEQARIREAMDTPTIQILDPARPPEKRSWPRRSWIAAFGFLLGLIAGAADASGRLPLLRRRARLAA